MSLIHSIKRFILKLYIRRISFPEFPDTEIVRQRLTYTGKVQRVGFRDEIKFLAQRLVITGHVRNVDSHMVIAELQGTPDRVEALKQVVKNEKRFIIERVEEEKLDVIQDESSFLIID